MNVEDPCRKGLSFMKTRLLTINTPNQKAFEGVLSNWASAGAKILNCGYIPEEESWWAIAEISANAKEKPCDIVKRVMTRGEFWGDSWPYGDEIAHTLYYDYVMFKTED